MKKFVFQFVTIFLLFLYGYGQLLSQDYIDFVAESNFQKIDKASSKLTLYKEISFTSFKKIKINLIDFELDEDEISTSHNNFTSQNYFLSFLGTQLSGNDFYFSKNNFFLFKNIYSSIFNRKYIMFSVFRL